MCSFPLKVQDSVCLRLAEHKISARSTFVQRLACLEHLETANRILHLERETAHDKQTDKFFSLSTLCIHLSGTNLSFLNKVHFPFLGKLQLKPRCNFLFLGKLHFTSYPDVGYNFSADAILIQSRGVHSVQRLEKYFVLLVYFSV